MNTAILCNLGEDEEYFRIKINIQGINLNEQGRIRSALIRFASEWDKKGIRVYYQAPAGTGSSRSDMLDFYIQIPVNVANDSVREAFCISLQEAISKLGYDWSWVQEKT